MGREVIGASNRIGIKSHMYSYCWRNIQPTPSDYNNNLSLCKFLRYSAYPYVVGTNRSGINNNFGNSLIEKVCDTKHGGDIRLEINKRVIL